MNIEEFVSEDNHMCNLCGDRFYKIFDQEVIYDLPNNELGNLREPLDSISELNASKQIYVYETWFSLIKCPDEMKLLAKRIILYLLD